MANIKKVQSYFRITTKAFNRKRRDNRSALLGAYKALFGGLRGNALDPITYFVSDEYKLVYIVNSKAACSAIKQGMMSSMGVEISGENYWDVHQEGIDRGYARKTLTEKEKKYFFFTFVRSPFSRLASLYVNKFCDQKAISRRGFRFKGYLGGVFDRDDSFEKFVTKVSRIPDVLCERHFKPQSYLINQEAVKIDFIGKFEEFSEDYKKLKQNYALKELNVVNKSNAYCLSDIYTQTTLDLVANRYEEDIEKFGYQNEYDKLKAML